MEYKNLNRAISAFMEDMWLPYEDSINCINFDIQNGAINEEELKKEFQLAINNIDLDWTNFANRTQLLSNPQNYLNIEIKNYVRFLLEDYLFPEKKLTEEQIDRLGIAVVNILKNKKDWVFSYDLYNELIQQKGFENIDYYDLGKIRFIELNIETKEDPGKEREIGYLKYVGQ